MIPKSFVISVLLIGIMLLGMVGCGSEPEELTEEKTEDPTVELSVPLLANEELLGSWEVVSIHGKTPQAHLQSLEQDGVTVEVRQFNCVFAADDSWTWNLELEYALDWPELPPAKVEAIGIWSGTYVIEDLTLSFVTTAETISIKPEPKNFLEVLGMAEDREAKEAFIKDVGPITGKSTYTKQGDTLTLITPAARKLVFERQ